MSKDPAVLDWQVYDAERRFVTAPADHLWQRALKVIDAKFERGDYADVLQALDEQTRVGLARALVDARFKK